jgi:hypothetical protein
MFSETFVINGFYLLEKSVSQIFKLTYLHFFDGCRMWANSYTISHGASLALVVYLLVKRKSKYTGILTRKNQILWHRV